MIIVSRHRVGSAPGVAAQIDYFTQRGTRPNSVGVEVVKLGIALVADDQTMCTVEEANSLRHVVECSVKLQVATGQFSFLLFDDVMLPFKLNFLSPPMPQR